MKNSQSILNKKEIKNFHKKLKEQFGFQGKLDYIFLKRKDKIFITSNNIKKLDLENFNINSIGLYIAEILPFGTRLSIEGSQLIGPKATKNILELKNPKNWMSGKDIETKKKFKSFVIIKHKKDFLGSGLFNKNKILNYIPKSRRTN